MSFSIIENATFKFCEAYEGAGLYEKDQNILIKNTSFIKNKGLNKGGAIAFLCSKDNNNCGLNIT